jgi:hypothetical protein
VFYLWWSTYNIPDSGAREYSATDISNSGVGKYYVQKQTYGIPSSDAS